MAVAAVAGGGTVEMLASVGQVGSANVTPEGPLFRGTSEGYLGGRATQLLELTSVSEDPVVATIFAIHTRTRYGTGVLHIAVPEDLDGLTFVESHPAYGELEMEIRGEFLPETFADRASITITVDQARTILSHLGISLPSRIYNPTGITDTLRETTRLSQKQIEIFIQKALLSSI